MIGNRFVRGPGEQRAEALAVGEAQLGARAAVEVDAVDDPGIGQVVVREQAQVTRAPRRREQDRRVHPAAADGVHERALLGAPGRPGDAAVAIGVGSVARGVEGRLQPDAAVLVEAAGEVGRELERLLARAAVGGEDDDQVRRPGRGDGAADRGQALVGVGDCGDIEAHGVDAHRREHLGVVLHAGELLGVDPALRDRSARRARSRRRAR